MDRDFFQIFSFALIEGDPTTALKDPGSIVLTQEMAQKIFGDKPAMGETLNLNADGDLQVTGIIKNVPHNSHFHFNYLVSINTLQERRARILDSWLGIRGCSYLLLEKNVEAEIVEKNILKENCESE